MNALRSICWASAATAAIFLGIYGPGRAAQNQSSQVPAPVPAQPAPSATGTPQGPDLVTITSELVQVPVIVRTKGGQMVRALKKEDFLIEEDGVAQSIATFARIEGRFGLKNNLRDTSSAGLGEAAIEKVSPYRILILFDTHHLWRELKRAKDASVKFIKEEKAPEEAVVVMTTHDEIAALQNFTSDPAQLAAAIGKIKGRPFLVINSLGVELTEYDAFEIDRGNRTVLGDFVQRYALKNGIRLTGTGESSSLQPSGSDRENNAGQESLAGARSGTATTSGPSITLRPVSFVQSGGGSQGGGGNSGGGNTGGGNSGGGNTGGGNPGPDTGGGTRPGVNSGGLGGNIGLMSMPRSSVEAQVKQAAQEMVMQASLNTLRGLESTREIIRRMGRLEGRKVVILLSEGYFLGYGVRSGFPLTEHMQALIDLAARNNVTFYPIDARGLATSGLTAEVSGQYARVGPQAAATLARTSASLSESQNGLHALASGTGGLTYFNRNDLILGFRRAIEDNTYYYVLGYTPTRPADGKYRKISVKMAKEGYSVRSREGYYALKAGQEVQLLKATGVTVPEKQYREAMKEATEAAKAMQAGQVDEAIKHFEKSAQIAPVSDRVFYYLAVLYQQKGDVPKTAEALRRSIEIAPAKPDASIALAKLHLGEPNLDEAAKVLAALVQVQPEQKEALYMLGITYEQLGKTQQAYESVSRAVAMKPEAVEMYLAAGRLAIRVGKDEEGFTHLRKYVQLQGQNAENIKKYLEQNGQKL